MENCINEICIPVYKNTYTFEVEELEYNSFDKSNKIATYKCNILADNIEQARGKFISECRPVGSIVCHGTKFINSNDNNSVPYKIILKDRKITLIEVKNNI